MLVELKVQDFAIIDKLHVVFRDGLNILSGETGAGKSVLLKSLSLLMGEKSDSDAVKTGAAQAVVEGIFDLGSRPDVREFLDASGIPAQEDLMIVRRVISSQGKGRVFINGASTTLSQLQEVVAPLIEVTGHSTPLIEMTGQHENKSLLSKVHHLEILDSYCGLSVARRNYHQKYQRRAEILAEIAELESQSRDRIQRLDFLTFQRDEIQQAGLKSGEDVALESDYKRLRHSARLLEFVEQAEDALSGDSDSVVGRLQKLSQKLQEMSHLDPGLVSKLESAHQIKAMAEDLSFEIRNYGKSLTTEGDLSSTEERLNVLRKLQKKYGATVDEILLALEKIETEIGTLEGSDDRIKELQSEIASLNSELEKLASELHKKRVAASKKLTSGVNEELKDLNMKGVVFQIQAVEVPVLTPTGKTDVEFLIQASPKDPARPLAKVASGGELSRILLSLKLVAGSGEAPRTYLFDEVDAGISGPTAEKVGKKLKQISKGQQVICVTHLAQVASFGTAHFLIQKSSSKQGVSMEVAELEKTERVKEIARLISGEKITKTSLAHAEELLRH